MVSEMTQESRVIVWTNRQTHPQTYTTENMPPRYAIAARVGIIVFYER